MNTEFDFNAYENIEDMVGYVGFIRPDGKFYRVRRFLAFADGVHPNWADAFAQKKNSFEYVITELKFMLVTEGYDNKSISCMKSYYDNQVIQLDFTDEQYKTYEQLKLAYERGENYGRKN